MKYNLLENSLDYILDAVSRLDEPEPDKRSVKYALVHLWSGVELLLKKRLMDEHWSLIFKNIDDKKASKISIKTGNFVSVYFNDLVKRLKDFCEIDISDSLDILEKVRKDRNKIEHFQVKTSKTQVISNLIKVWAFILDFTSNHMDITLDETASNIFEQIREIMVRHEEFISHRKMAIASDLTNQLKTSNYNKPLTCPECFQKAIPLSLNDDDEIKCIFCNTSKNWNDFVVEWKSTWNYSGPFDCLHCGNEGVCQIEDGWICVSCCEKWDSEELDICTSCETRLVSNPLREPCCDYCLSSMYE